MLSCSFLQDCNHCQIVNLLFYEYIQFVNNKDTSCCEWLLIPLVHNHYNNSHDDTFHISLCNESIPQINLYIALLRYSALCSYMILFYVFKKYITFRYCLLNKGAFPLRLLCPCKQSMHCFLILSHVCEQVLKGCFTWTGKAKSRKTTLKDTQIMY